MDNQDSNFEQQRHVQTVITNFNVFIRRAVCRRNGRHSATDASTRRSGHEDPGGFPRHAGPREGQDNEDRGTGEVRLRVRA